MDLHHVSVSQFLGNGNIFYKSKVVEIYSSFPSKYTALGWELCYVKVVCLKMQFWCQNSEVFRGDLTFELKNDPIIEVLSFTMQYLYMNISYIVVHGLVARLQFGNDF
jgi:hypothetical protein